MSDFKPNPDDSDALPGLGPEVLFEVIAIGNTVKVTAIDPDTGLEASIVGAATTTLYSLKANAMRKLARVLARHVRGADPDAAQAAKPARRGRYA